ncbi:MAG: ferredoxin, partial [Clostridia bacterium]|nr:ferredoxin [Clostridia bacterium]
AHKAKKANHDGLEKLKDYRYRIALPAPALYGQFDNMDNIGYIISGLKAMGFDKVYEVARAAEMVSGYTRMYLRRTEIKKPVISSACPVIARIISMNFPFLCDNVIPLLPPIEVAARLARKEALEENPELSPEDIGVFFISPCPAKVSYVKNGFAGEQNNVDCVLSIRDVYFELIEKMEKIEEPEDSTEAGMIGIGWASCGGEASAVFNEHYLAADGIENCIRVLEQIDNEDIPSLDYVELNACSGGCVGGVMNVANPYIAQARLKSLRRYLPVSPNAPTADEIPSEAVAESPLEYNPNTRLSDNRAEAMRMMTEIENICSELPGLDCGSCGAPTCVSFAEDIVKGETNADECTVHMRMLFHDFLEKRRNGKPGDAIPLEKWMSTERRGDSQESGGNQ